MWHLHHTLPCTNTRVCGYACAHGGVRVMCVIALVCECTHAAIITVGGERWVGCVQCLHFAVSGTSAGQRRRILFIGARDLCLFFFICFFFVLVSCALLVAYATDSRLVVRVVLPTAGCCRQCQADKQRTGHWCGHTLHRRTWLSWLRPGSAARLHTV